MNQCSGGCPVVPFWLPGRGDKTWKQAIPKPRGPVRKRSIRTRLRVDAVQKSLLDCVLAACKTLGIPSKHPSHNSVGLSCTEGSSQQSFEPTSTLSSRVHHANASFARNCPAHVVAATQWACARWQAAPRRIDARSHCYRRRDGATSRGGRREAKHNETKGRRHGSRATRAYRRCA